MNPAESLPFALAGLVVIAATVLGALGAVIPDALWAIALTAVGGAAGAAIPRRTAGSSTPPAPEHQANDPWP